MRLNLFYGPAAMVEGQVGVCVLHASSVHEDAGVGLSPCTVRICCYPISLSSDIGEDCFRDTP